MNQKEITTTDIEPGTRLAFIGGGNMARSLIGGLLQNGWAAGDITVSDPDPEQPARLYQLDRALNVIDDNQQAAATADVVVFAVKPQILQPVCRALAGTLTARRPLILSIAAGIRSTDIDRWCGGGLPVVRCMPNTPALVQSGATGLYANDTVSEAQRALAETLMRAVGTTVWLDDETLLNAVTALSGSGPAYVFLVIEAMQAAGEQLGLPTETAALLAIETVFGAAKLALESPENAATLRARVTSKGGTTERALEVLEGGHLRQLFADALAAASQRAEELAEQLGKDQ